MMERQQMRRSAALLVTLVVLVAGCVGDSDDSFTDDAESVAGEVDLSLTRSDIECSEDVLGANDQTRMLAAHFVVDGALGEVCFGDEDPTLIRAFEALAVITPPGQLSDMGLFAGYTWEGGDDATLAFVGPIDDEGSQFLMAIGLDSYDNDPDEASLTIAHEFSHIFTETTTQLDRSGEPDDCDTHWNGSGCYADDSLMAAWIDQFWPPELLGQVDVDNEPSTADGEFRCAVDDSFFGTYAATTPEEDLAEAFSAYVYDLTANTDGQQAKLDWLADQPGLVEFHERAEAAGLTPLNNNFDICG